MKSNLLMVDLAEDLELAGLVWQPEIGDEISDRQEREQVQILVDPQGLSPSELRSMFLWLPTVEQLVHQFEARQAILEHVGFELSKSAMIYRTVVKFKEAQIEATHQSMRLAMGFALRDLLLASNDEAIN
jgi:hypothetical protein